ncbi:RecB family exonuclease [Spirilliplanes yamanashiensis]|uniref:RecB family exonuclease n=1 Tax=Spirilliplanes yamanashiensis TaxID=42233 RepID=UPI001951C685|nr:PD-(D/E)XK nuclease family protein [Spirilliplanes yamanashiensis]
MSPSRAADFKTCPLLYRFRSIDRLPERPTADQLRGTLVHAVLERLFDLPAAERTPEAAAALVAPQWAELLEREPALAQIFEPAPAGRPAGELAEAGPTGEAGRPGGETGRPGGEPAVAGVGGKAAAAGPGGGAAQATQAAQAGAAGAAGAAGGVPVQTAIDVEITGAGEDRVGAFLASASGLLGGYFRVEDPTRLEPAERESLVSTLVDDELTIRGYIDRLDVSPAGDLRVVDYKTGGAPREAFEARALFQLKFYALVLWRTRGVVPRVLRLLYLKDAEVCDYSPDAEELERFERTVVALWRAIEQATAAQDFRPKPSRLCGWCSHQALCPAYGGTPPPFPQRPAPSDSPADAAADAAETVGAGAREMT